MHEKYDVIHVHVLIFRNNGLSDIPPEIGQLTSLTQLYLWGNQIRVIPSEIGQLTSLTVLRLGNNQISMIPPEIGQLTGLTQLGLYDNQIEAIPRESGQLTNLTQLNLAGNQISVILPEIGQLNQLKDLYLEGNQIGVIPPELYQLTSLTQLDLGNNQISMILPEIGQLTNLEVLGLESNLIISLPTEIGDLINLTDLNLKNNKLTQLSSAINRLSKLQSLNLCQNRFQEFPAVVTQLSNLQRLHLENNQIRSLPLTIKNLTKLEQLWLGENFLKQLPTELGQLTSLTQLHLGRNEIYRVPLEIGDLTKLVSLNLSCNRLTEIPSQILDLRQLETLSLEGNTRSEIVTDFGKLLTYREQMEQAVEKAKIAQQQSEASRQEAVAAREQAENANQAKGRFLSQMSHEIRTPMNGVIGSLNLINVKKLDPREREHLQRAKNSGQYLLTIINEILQFTELNAGKITYQQDPFDLVEACQQILEILLPLCQQKGIQLKLDYPFMMPARWLGDQQKTKQVLLNLVANAIKFTMVGEVKLKLRTTNHGIRAEIIDTGIGIAEDQIENIFESFTQASQGTNRRYDGTGLGLSISQGFVEGMGGKIGVESQLGQGSTFWFKLPLEPVDLTGRQPEMKKAEPTDLSGKRGLVVDDNLVNRFIARKHLENLGCVVDEAVNSKQCLGQHQQQQYDLILMDLQMPEVDGFQATQQIRQLEQSSGLKRVTIVALTTNLVGEVWERCKSAGMDGYVGKPFKPEELMEQLKQVMD